MLPIPKNIIQVWIGDKKNIPETYKISYDSIQKYLVPNGWNYRLFMQDEIEQLISTKYNWFWETYNSFPYLIQKADAARPFLLKEYGGVYLDMHFEILANLDPLFAENTLFTGKNNAYFLPSPNVPSVFTNAFIAASPDATILDLYITEMMEYSKNSPWWHIGKHFVVMNSTGPLALTRAIQKSKNVVGYLPNSILAPCSVCNLDQCPSKSGQLMRQMQGKTWHSVDSTIFDFIRCKWKSLVLILIIFIIIYFNFYYL